MAQVADHKGLASPRRHDLYPRAFLTLAVHVQVAKGADVVNFYVHCRSAHLALVRLEPFDKLVAFEPASRRLLVYKDGLSIPLQGYATELRHLGAFPTALLDFDLEANACPMLGLHGALVAPYDFPACGLVLGRKGPCQRHLHDRLQSPEMGDVVGQKVLVDGSPELRLVPVHDGVIRIVYEDVAVCRFAVFHVGTAVLLDDFCGNP